MATAKAKRISKWPGPADLVGIAAKIARDHGPITRSRLEDLVRESGVHFSSTRFGHALDRFGADFGLEATGTRPRVWRAKPEGYGPDPAPNGNAHWNLKPADVGTEPPAPNGNGHPRRTLLQTMEAEAAGNGHGVAAALENVSDLAQALGIEPEAKGHTVNARIPLLRDVIEDDANGFPHPDRIEEPELVPAVEVSPVNGVTFPACDGRGSWVVMGSRDEPASLMIVPPRGPSMGLTVSSAVALADALRRVASHASVRLREAQAAGGS